jgi:hypothetical protein
LQVALGGLGRHTEFISQDAFIAGAKVWPLKIAERYIWLIAQGMYSNLLVYNAAQIVTTPISTSYNPEDMHIWTGLPWNLGRHPAVRVSFGKVLNVLTSVVRLITAFSCIPLELLIPKWHGRCIPTFS